MPVLVLVAITQAVLVLKPWNHTSVGGPALPTLAPAVTPAQPPLRATTPGRPSCPEASLEVLLNTENTLRWSCTSDPSGRWDYACLLSERRGVGLRERRRNEDHEPASELSSGGAHALALNGVEFLTGA